jgi:hypothetical protein
MATQKTRKKRAATTRPKSAAKSRKKPANTSRGGAAPDRAAINKPATEAIARGGVAAGLPRATRDGVRTHGLDVAVGDAIRDGLVDAVQQGPSIWHRKPKDFSIAPPAWRGILLKVRAAIKPLGFCFTVTAPIVDKTHLLAFGETADHLIGITTPC